MVERRSFSEMECKSKPEVSILVPVYNVENYLKECLDSILNQTFKDWECILVDDGSIDSSGSICDEYSSRDSRFQVIHVENGGAAFARNTSIKVARGNYITFCDSDDWLEPNAVAVMYKLIREYDADVVQTGLWKEYKGKSKVKHFVVNTEVLNRQQVVTELIRDKKVRSYVNKMYRRHIIGADYPLDNAYEDVYVLTVWLLKVNIMVCTSIPVYHYRMRNGSQSKVGSSKNRLDFFESMRFRAEEILKSGIVDYGEDDYVASISKAAVSAGKIISRRELDKQKSKTSINYLSESIRKYNLSSMRSVGIKQWFRIKLLRNNPRLFSRIMRVIGWFDLHSLFRRNNMFK